MFRETLLESATSNRKRKRWPMILAFTAEIVVGSLLVMLPLLSTGVISVSVHAPQLVAMRPLSTAPQRPVSNNFPRSSSAPVFGAHFVTISTSSSILSSNRFSDPFPPGDSPSADPNIIGSRQALPEGLLTDGKQKPPVQEPERTRRIRVSVMSEGQLVYRVDPIYPRIAIISGTQGEVRLHAVIAKDGTIQSLSVTKGAPLLVGAALDAVRQWRYKPYMLNGEAVEVETLIVVNFKKTND